ncbi:probable rRNA-processing protein EBP2 [Daphnia carinata]|uniref:probable rRNA-processing protein EBP2 n=1 Tax=Daphnia carinata TaxID=120202 RepID=UPI00257DF425|nr:probable rRNA-processing protein EBP2 [Daphnia carinata]
MKKKLPVKTFESESEETDIDSDEELLEAFESGEVKPGLNQKAPAPRQYTNNSKLLNAKLNDMVLKLDWIERLDLTTKLDPIVDGILNSKEETQPTYKIETPGDRIVDDLQRETLFYRQAQSAIIEGLARLKTLGIPTRRPEDYFAQMAKSDDHMLKVKRRILTQQVAQEKCQKVKKLRELKKYGKKVQVEVGLQRAKEKRELLSKVKQYREGKLASLDFLDDDGGKKKNMVEITKQKTKEKNEFKQVFQPMSKGLTKGKGKGKSPGKGKSQDKRKSKENKFGFGGKKSGTKKNNMKKDSGNDRNSKGGQRGPKNRQGGKKMKGGGRKR